MEKPVKSTDFAKALLPLIGVTDGRLVQSIQIVAAPESIVRVEVTFILPITALPAYEDAD